MMAQDSALRTSKYHDMVRNKNEEIFDWFDGLVEEDVKKMQAEFDPAGIDYWKNKMEWWKFVYADANLYMGTDRQVPDVALNPPKKPTVACVKNYYPDGVFGQIYLAAFQKNWEEGAKMFDMTSLENAMKQTKVMRQVGDAIQSDKQEEALKIVEDLDKKVTDLIDNYDNCGKADDPSMVYHQANHDFWQYIIDEINKEFSI